MKKIQLNELKNKIIKCINVGEMSRVFLLDDGRILKIFDVHILQVLKNMGIDVEGKIIDSENRRLPNEILKPDFAVYDGFCFIGDITNPARGIDHNTWDRNLTFEQRTDMFMYADVHSKLEKVVRSTPDIVYPDICTCDNIYVDVNNGNVIQLIDYDGLQVGSHASISISTTLGNPTQYFGSKKYTDGKLFTKELDKKSLILLYFLNTFNVDLNKVGKRNPSTGKAITLDDVFECIDLKDLDVMHKVWKIFNEKEHNEWLGEDIFRLADDYELAVYPVPVSDNIYLKKLVRR